MPGPIIMTHEQVGQVMPPGIEIGKPELQPNSLFVYFEGALLKQPAELLTISLPDPETMGAETNIYYRGVLGPNAFRIADQLASKEQGWTLHRIEFPAGARPSPEQVNAHLAWYMTDQNTAPEDPSGN